MPDHQPPSSSPNVHPRGRGNEQDYHPSTDSVPVLVQLVADGDYVENDPIRLLSNHHARVRVPARAPSRDIPLTSELILTNPLGWEVIDSLCSVLKSQSHSQGPVRKWPKWESSQMRSGHYGPNYSNGAIDARVDVHADVNWGDASE